MYRGGYKPNCQQQQTTEHEMPLYRLQLPYQPEHKYPVVRMDEKEKKPLLSDDDEDNDIVKHNTNAVAELYDQSPPMKIYQSFVPNR